MMKSMWLLIIVFLLSGCATPAGKFTDADFSIVSVTGDLPQKEAVNNFKKAFRYCGHDNGILECIELQDMTVCDIYTQDLMGQKTPWLFGSVDFKINGEIRYKVPAYHLRKEVRTNNWKLFAAGREKEVCPER